MLGVNKAILIGTVGQDPMSRQVNETNRVSNFSIATNRTYKDRQGQKQEKVEWHRIEVWNALSDITQSYVRKGTHVFIEGEIRYEKFTDKNGKEVNFTKIVADKITLLPSANGGNRAQGYQAQPAYQNQPVQNQPVQNQPVQQQPVQQQPVQKQPVQQQPVQQQPVQQQPVQNQPVQQAVQEANNYVTDQQFKEGTDDLPF